MLRLSSLALLALTTVGCVAEQSVDLVIVSEVVVADERSWTVVVTPGECRPVDQPLYVGGGMGADRYKESAAVGSELRAVGALDDQSYAFIAYYRDSNCFVTRYGCANANPYQESTIRIEVGLPPAELGVTGCAGGLEQCSDGMCMSGSVTPPSECTETSDGEVCELADGLEGVCCRGVCSEASSTECDDMTTPCEGVDTTNDPSHCGECRHACEPGLGCDAGICQATPPIRELFIDGGADGLIELSRMNAHIAYVWQVPAFAGGSEAILAVTNSQRIDADGTEGGFFFDVPTLDSLPGEVWLSELGPAPLAAASIVVAEDTDGDGDLTIDDFGATGGDVTELALVADVIVVASEGNIPRNDGSAVSAFFPEGVAAGVRPYRGSGDRQLWPMAETTVVLSMCYAGAACEDPLRF